MWIGIHPIFIIAAIVLICLLICIFAVIKFKNRILKYILSVMVIIFFSISGLIIAALKPELIDARFRTYKNLYKEINIGMSRADVMSLIVHNYPAEGKRLPPIVLENSETKLDLFMNPEKSKEPNCEGIFLKLENDKVIEKTYSRD